MKSLSEHIQEGLNENNEIVQQLVIEKNVDATIENKNDETVDNKTFLDAMVGTSDEKAD
jgi:hypothetical protein